MVTESYRTSEIIKTFFPTWAVVKQKPRSRLRLRSLFKNTSLKSTHLIVYSYCCDALILNLAPWCYREMLQWDTLVLQEQVWVCTMVNLRLTILPWTQADRLLANYCGRPFGITMVSALVLIAFSMLICVKRRGEAVTLSLKRGRQWSVEFLGMDGWLDFQMSRSSDWVRHTTCELLVSSPLNKMCTLD